MSKIVRKFHPDETPQEQALVMIYELGDYAKCLQRMLIEPESANLYEVEAKKALSDLVTQIWIACDRFGWHLEDLVEMGMNNLRDKSKRWIRHE